MNYLTDDELAKLISEAECEDMPPAPENIMEDILLRIDKRKKNKASEYRLYCAKVIVSVAASVAFVLTVPFFKGYERVEYPDKSEVITESISKEEYLNGKDRNLFETLKNEHLGNLHLDFWNKE